VTRHPLIHKPSDQAKARYEPSDRGRSGFLTRYAVNPDSRESSRTHSGATRPLRGAFLCSAALAPPSSFPHGRVASGPSAGEVQTPHARRSQPSRREWGLQRPRRPWRRRGAAPATPVRQEVRAWLLRPPRNGWQAQARRLQLPRCSRACTKARLRAVPCAAVVTRVRTTCCARLRCSTGRRRLPCRGCSPAVRNPALRKSKVSIDDGIESKFGFKLDMDNAHNVFDKMLEGGESPRRATSLVHWRVPAQGLSPAILRHLWLSPVSRRPLALMRGRASPRLPLQCSAAPSPSAATASC
jgi:hypothetical protein